MKVLSGQAFFHVLYTCPYIRYNKGCHKSMKEFPTEQVVNKMEVTKMSKEEIMKNAMDEFGEIQEYMISAHKENAQETYAKLKKKYLRLKALLNSLGVTLTDIDEIKE